jgi:Zn-dependent protease with chaperone function
VRLDTANRSFLLLLAVALAPFLLLGLLGCGVLSLAAFRVATDGTTGWAVEAWPAVGFLAVSAVGTVLGLRSLWRQVRATVELGRFVRDHRIPVDPVDQVDEVDEVDDVVVRVAAAEGVVRLALVDCDEAFSFTFGIRRPCVVVSRGLVAGLDEGELRAVLAHERYHVRNHDPLKIVVARAVPSAFFFLPALRHLRVRYAAGRELAADRRAMRASGRRSLVGALYKLAGGGPSTAVVGAAAAIAGADHLDVRLAQLEEGHEPPLPPLPALALVATAAGVALAAVGLAATASLMGWWAGAPAGMGGDGPLQVAGGAVCAVAWLAGGLVVHGQLSAGRAVDE